MRNFNKLSLVTLGLLAGQAAHAQLGVATGTAAPTSTLQVNGSLAANYTSIAAATYTLTGTDFYVVYNGSTAATFTLPSGVGVKGRLYNIKNTTSSQTLTVNAASGEGVDGNVSFVVPPGQGVQLVTTGTTVANAMSYEVVSFAAATSAGAAAGTSWGLTGNAGTNASTNFLGTTDNVDLILKRGNVVAAQLRNGTYNGGSLLVGSTSFGVGALARNNDSLSFALGFKAGQRSTNGTTNQFIGHESGYNNTTGSYNQFSGYLSGFNNTTGGSNQFSGSQSGYKNTTGNSNLFIGPQSGYSNTTGNSNLFIGHLAGTYSTASFNQFIGYVSGRANTTGSFNHFSGNGSGFSNVTGNNNLFNGYASGYFNTTGSNNQFVGYGSGQSNTTGSNNQFSGYQSGVNNTIGHSNLYIGNSSGYVGTTNSYNTILGDSAGLRNTASFNQFMGYQSGYANTSGGGNQFSGYRSGYNNTTGSNNQFIGYRSGFNNTTGSNNTLLGYNSNVGSGGLTNATAIGYLAQVNQSNSLVLGSISGSNGATASTNVGIGTASPSFPLDVQTISGGIRVGNYSYLTSNNATTGYANNAPNISINAAGRVAASEFDAYSDARLKTVQGLSNSRADLALVKQIQITDYQMRDKVQYGNRAFKKVIAQQVESVFPQAINKNTGFIPSIYAAGTLRAGAPDQTLVTVPAAHGLKVGDKVRLIGEANGKIETTVLALSGNNTFAVALPQPETKLFVFGLQVADLRTVDYEALSMLNVSATQELARQVETLQAANAKLQAQADASTTAQTELSGLKADLQNLRTLVQQLQGSAATAQAGH